MRVDNAAFAVKNESLNKDPRYIIELAFDNANTDLHYFTSHADAAVPSGATVTQSVVKSVSATSQKLDPIKAVATIGSINVGFFDRGEAVTTLINNKLVAGDGLRKKRLRFYRGYEGLGWSDYVLFQTQIIDDIRFDGGVYNIGCSDIQRSVRKEIFNAANTRLTSTIDENAASIPVLSTADFQAVAHGTSYTDAPGQEVVYIWLGDEAIRCPVANITPTVFGNVTRGVLNTKAARHEVDPTADYDRKPEVEELVYLEMPAPKLAYALLTGSLYNQAGKSLPDSWHLNIDPQYIKTSDFTGIGSDWWNPNDDAQGVVVRFVREKKQDGKKFIEEQLNRLLGAFNPVYSDGSLGLRRMSGVLSDSSYTLTLDKSNAMQTQPLNHDMRSVHNHLRMKWNYDPIAEKTTREHFMQDNLSISRHNLGDPMTMEFRGLHGSRHTQAMISQRFDSLRSRYAGPPLRMGVHVFDRLNTVEVGDIARATFNNVRDYTGGTTSVDRAFEVQGTTIDSVTGHITLNLFGSAEKAGAIVPTTASTVQADSFYTSEGADIQSYLDTNFPGAFTVIGGVGHIQADCTLPGHADMNNAAAIYYYDGPLDVDNGVTVTISNNVQIRIRGFLQNNGNINGKGQGLLGGLQSNLASTYESQDLGVSGYFGSTKSGGGFTNVSGTLNYKSDDGWLVQGQVDVLPEFTLDTANLSASLPPDLRGTSGSTGHNTFVPASYHKGGSGGNGGAGLIIISRGYAAGGSGNIDLSGEDGQDGVAKSIINGSRSHAGSGAGGQPGCLLMLVDGNNNVTGIPSNFTANVGVSNVTGTQLSQLHDVLYFPSESHSYYIGFSGESKASAAHGIQFIPENLAPQEDVPDATSNPLSFTLTEYTNTPPSPAGNLSSIEITVTPPSDGNYSYAMIYSRVQGASTWGQVGPADDEYVAVVPSDGVTYEFQARGVSIVGVENTVGPVQSIAVSTIDDPYTIASPAGLAAQSGTAHLLEKLDGTFLSRILVSWTSVIHQKLIGYRVQWKKTSDTVWGGDIVVTAPDTSAYISDVQDGVDYDIRVLSFTNVVEGGWGSITHSVLGKTERPPDVATFLVQRQPDGTREFSWTYTPPVDHAGYKIRYILGSSGTWPTMAPLHEGLLTSSPHETNQLAAGTYTFAIVAVDTTGNESANPLFINGVVLLDPRIAGSIDSADPKAMGWPGTKTDCWVYKGILYATDTKTWADFAIDGVTWADWTSYARAPSSPIIYEHPTIDVGVVATFIPLVSATGNGTIVIEESHSDDDVSYTSWVATGAQITARYIKVRVTVTNASSLASITQMFIILSADPVTEDIEDLDTSTLTGANRIAVGHIKLPINKTYAVIKRADVVLQSVGAGWTWELISKSDLTNGPEIKIYNASNVLADATIDATIRGV